MAESTPITEIEWRPAVGYPGYAVSSDGRVKSIARMTTRGGRPARVYEKILRGYLKRSSTGRPATMIVTLKLSGKTVYVRVHHLVLNAFVGPCPEGMEGCHNDGNPANNSVANLRWDTPSANREDSIRHGTNKNPPIHIGTKHPRAKM